MNASALVGAVTVLLLGLAVGSFLNVVAFRMPRGRSVVSPPSACPSCGAPIRPRDNVPVLSWLLLRGRCRACSAAISPRYPIVEALTGLGFLTAYIRFGPGVATLSTCALISLAVAAALTDIDSWKIPDRLLIPFAFLAILFLAAAPAPDLRSRGYFILIHTAWSLGAAAVLLALAALVARLAGAERGIGMGDIKYVVVLGLYLGSLLPVAIMAAAASGSLFALATRGADGKPGRVVRFGPFLSFGAVFAAFYGARLVNWYLSLSGVA